MKLRLQALVGFYLSISGIVYLVGLAALGLRLLGIGPSAALSAVAVVGIVVGLPLRIQAHCNTLHVLLEEERQITHNRLSTLEDTDS